MFSRAVRIARIRGIEVRVDPTLIVLAALIVWTFAGRFALEHGLPTALGMATAGMLLFLGSVLAHEMAHALEAVHRGVGVESVTLLIFGGVTQMHAHGSRPRDEFAIAAVGPFVSLLCGSVFGLVAAGAAGLPAALSGPVAQLAGLLALLNVLLAVFNLVPGAPLDGGRVLRAGLWWLLDDRSRAVRWAARAGQVLGLALIALGVVFVLVAPQALIGSLWYVAIGAFLLWAASSEHRQSRLDDLYTGTRVRDLLGHLSPATSPTAGPLHPDDDTGGEPHPTVDLDADLHTLVAAFQSDPGHVVLVDGHHEHGIVSEQQVAHAISRVRRSDRAGPQATVPAGTTSP